jgi:hypothetical protein
MTWLIRARIDPKSNATDMVNGPDAEGHAVRLRLDNLQLSST